MIKLNAINKSDVFILIYLLFQIKGFFWDTQSVISSILLALLFIISSYYFVYANLKYKSKYLSALTLFVVTLSIYGIISMIQDDIIMFDGSRVPNHTFITNNLVSLLPIYVFYVFGREYDIHIRQWFWILFIGAIISFVVDYRHSVELALQDGFESEGYTNNIGYFFLSLLPLIYFLKEKALYQFFALFICALGVIISMKRGAIAIFFLCSLLFFSQFLRYNRGGRNRVRIISIFIIIIVFFIFFAQEYLLNNSFFEQRLSRTLDGDSSGRDTIYQSAIDYFFHKASFFSFLFGTGANQTFNILGNKAHNDWLELAVNMGVLGLLEYSYYWLVILYYLKKSKKLIVAHKVLLMFAIIYFLKTFISMSYYDMNLYSSLALGWSISQIDIFLLKKNNIYNVEGA